MTQESYFKADKSDILEKQTSDLEFFKKNFHVTSMFPNTTYLFTFFPSDLPTSDCTAFAAHIIWISNATIVFNYLLIKYY